MAIVIKTDKKGRKYAINNKTGKRVTMEYAQRITKLQRYSARPKGKPSEASCSTAGKDLKTKRTSSAGSLLMKCGAPKTYYKYFGKKAKGIVKNRKGFRPKKK